MERTADDEGLIHYPFSTVRFTDYSRVTADPSDKSLGYYQSSANADWEIDFLCKVWAALSLAIQEVLGFETPMEVDGFLKSHGVYLDYTEETLEEDLATSRRVRSQHRAE